MGCTQSHKQTLDNGDVYKKTAPRSNGSTKPQENRGDDTFSQQHKDILRETWKIISANRQEKGVAIFIQIFQERPDLQKYFPFKNVHGDELLHNIMFRSHALRFINAVDTTIQSLDALEVALIPVLHHLGKQHVPIVGFNPEDLPIFMASLLRVFEKELEMDASTGDVHEAWAKLGEFIALKMTEGYNEAIREQNNDCIKDTTNEAGTDSMQQSYAYQGDVTRNGKNEKEQADGVKENGISQCPVVEAEDVKLDCDTKLS